MIKNIVSKIKKKINNKIKKKINNKINFKNKNFKLKKKWRHWRMFKRYFINIKKIIFFKKLRWSFNNVRIIQHQLIKLYLPQKNKPLLKYKKKIGANKFYFFLRKLELRLGVLLLRARFFFKLINCHNAIKFNFILVNGIIIPKIYFVLKPLDLFQKRRPAKTFFKNILKRYSRLKWRKHRWKQARFIFWKVRRVSHFNLYWVRKQNTILNYLEINYKIPGGVVIKQPFLKELLLNRQSKILSNLILKKFFFLY